MTYYVGHAYNECPYCGDLVASIALHLFNCKSAHEDTVVRYVVGCVDYRSKKLGCFGYDERKYLETDNFWAITPVFTEVQDLFKWFNENNIKCAHKND